MKPVVVCAVERSGTHFASWLVGSLIHRQPAWAVPTGGTDLEKDNIGVLVTHVYPEGFRSHSDAMVSALVGYSRLKCVVPLRHPLRVLISKHERPRDPCDGLCAAKALTRVAGWRHRDQIHYLKVDAEGPEIGPEIDRLAEFLGAESRNPGWAPRNETPPGEFSELRRRFDAGEDISSHFSEELAVLEPVWPFFEGFGYSLEHAWASR